MKRKHHTSLVVAALTSTWTIAAPAMAAGRDAQFAAVGAPADRESHAGARVYLVGGPARRTGGPTAPQNFVNQGPHSFGDPAATGGVAIGQPGPMNFVNQGGHAMGDPAASGQLPARPMTMPPAPANQGPHPFG